MRALNYLLGGIVLLVFVTHLREFGAWAVYLTTVKIPTP